MPGDDPTGLTLPTQEEQELEDMKKRIREEFEDRSHRPLTAKDFKALAEFCETMNSALLAAFMHIQETVKQGALAFAKAAEILEENAKQTEKRTKVENVFESDEPTDTGPITDKP